MEYNDKFMTVSEEGKIVTLTWKKETENLTDEEFKKEALQFVSIVKNQNVKRILVDMRQFHYVLNEKLIEWRNKNVIKVYNSMNVEKFAFVSKKATVQQNDSGNTFVTCYFLTKKEAEEWLKKE